jgi:hypothetical protein
MALDFPSSPTNGQVFGDYTYDSTAGGWRSSALEATGLPAGGAANQLLSKVNSTDYNTQWITAVPIANGGTGSTLGAGLVPITPSSVTGGGTNTINADGSVTLTSSTNTVFNGVFTSAYRNYKVIFSANTTPNFANQQYLRMASGGSVNLTTNYSYVNWYIQAGAGTATSSTLNSNSTLQNVAVLGFLQDMEMTFFGPQLVRSTQVHFNSVYNHTVMWGESNFNATTQFDGFQLLNNTLNGVVRIYGLS